MPRTRTTAKKVSGAKAPRKKEAQAPATAGPSTSNAARRTRSSGGNPVQARPTPKWQKPITGFGKGKINAAKDKATREVRQDGNEKNGHGSGSHDDAEEDTGPSRKKAKRSAKSGSGASSVGDENGDDAEEDAGPSRKKAKRSAKSGSGASSVGDENGDDAEEDTGPSRKKAKRSAKSGSGASSVGDENGDGHGKSTAISRNGTGSVGQSSAGGAEDSEDDSSSDDSVKSVSLVQKPVDDTDNSSSDDEEPGSDMSRGPHRSEISLFNRSSDTSRGRTSEICDDSDSENSHGVVNRMMRMPSGKDEELSDYEDD